MPIRLAIVPTVRVEQLGLGQLGFHLASTSVATRSSYGQL